MTVLVDADLLTERQARRAALDQASRRVRAAQTALDAERQALRAIARTEARERLLPAGELQQLAHLSMAELARLR